MAFCPGCQGEFDRRAKGGTCPLCDVQLNLEKEKIEGVWVNQYVLANPEPVEEKVVMKETTVVDKGEDKTYLIEFNGFMPGTRLVCPNCKDGFEAILSFKGSFERKCDCGFTTTYVFNIG